VKGNIPSRDPETAHRPVRGATVWLTGLSGSGKSTLAAHLARALRGLGCATELLDGDQIRAAAGAGLGFGRADRDTHVRRIGARCADLMAGQGIAIVAAISPYRATRDECRALVESRGAGFIEVAMQCPLPVLIRRDPKGLYKKALAGEIKNFTGISDPYEPPIFPEATVDISIESVDSALRRLVQIVRVKTT
jgi:adenylyl-sulfate kinase